MRIVKREEWGADPKSVGKYGKMPGAVSEVNVHHTVTPSSETPLEAVKRLERGGVSEYGVFYYSFVIHRDGTILEGCGWEYVGAHTKDRNSRSYGISFIGNYENETLTAKQTEAFRWLLYRGRVVGRIINPDIWPHQKWKATACPGKNVLAVFDELLVPWVRPARYVMVARRVFKNRQWAKKVKARLERMGFVVSLKKK